MANERLLKVREGEAELYKFLVTIGMGYPSLEVRGSFNGIEDIWWSALLNSLAKADEALKGNDALARIWSEVKQRIFLTLKDAQPSQIQLSDQNFWNQLKTEFGEPYSS